MFFLLFESVWLPRKLSRKMQKQKKSLNIAFIFFFEQRGIHIKKFKNFEALSIGLVVVMYVFNFVLLRFCYLFEAYNDFQYIKKAEI